MKLKDVEGTKLVIGFLNWQSS